MEFRTNIIGMLRTLPLEHSVPSHREALCAVHCPYFSPDIVFT